MASIVSWAALAGAWLVFVGAIYQAALEIRSHVVARDRIASVASQVAVPPPVSPWWWLVPPVKMLRERERAHAYRRDWMLAMDDEDFVALLKLRDKATGWMFVALGALLLAVSQTFTFAHDHAFGDPIFVALAVGLALLSILLCVARIAESDKALRMKRAGKTTV